MEILYKKEVVIELFKLIENAQKYLIIVSPFNGFEYWADMQRALKDAVQRGVEISYFIRKPKNEKDDTGKSAVVALGINPIEIENLHAKLYLNERKAIVTSMNMYHYSGSNSIEIGYKTISQEEYDEIYKFYENEILNTLEDSVKPKLHFSHEWIKGITAQLLAVDIPLNETAPKGIYRKRFFTTANKEYQARISYLNGDSFLIVSTILSPREFSLFMEKIGDLNKSRTKKFELNFGYAKEASVFTAKLTKPLKTTNIDYVFKEDFIEIGNLIFEFIKMVEKEISAVDIESYNDFSP